MAVSRWPDASSKPADCRLSPSNRQRLNGSSPSGFGWLRHLKSANSELATANARALVDDWMRMFGKRIGGIAWAPEVTAQRIIAWLQHSTSSCRVELPAYRKFMRSLAMQVRYLRTVAAAMDDGEERLRARIALAFAALALPVSPPTARAARRNLEYELKRQIMRMAGISRAIPLRSGIAGRSSGRSPDLCQWPESPPKALIEAVERMLPACASSAIRWPALRFQRRRPNHAGTHHFGSAA
ncbi:hypothetical protein [Brucella suis]|uniref:hypothetical protein n=1 Tax=Brucella suis TaxID=29461 RepID=UPI000D85180F|nr:hypothetical protein [Brucella suis]SPU71681.1 putative Cytosolic Protein [Brucella suis]